MPISSHIFNGLAGNCLRFLQFLAKINLLKPQKTYIYRFLPNLPAVLNCYNMPPDCDCYELNRCNMLPATIASSSISDQTPSQQYRHPSTTKIPPRHKKASKAVSSHHFRSLSPKSRISKIKFLL